MSNQTEWRWADPAGQQRLVREEDLRKALQAGVVPANAPVWTRGWSTWKPAHDVPELMGGKSAQVSHDGSVPPPPMFIVAAQDAFEGKAPAVPEGPAEPPPPPRYVPLAPQTQPQVPFVPQAPSSDTKIDPPKVISPAASKPPAKPPAALTATRPSAGVTAKPQTAPPPLPSKAQQWQKKAASAPPPLPPAAKRKSVAPPAPPAPAPTPAVVSAPATAHVPPAFSPAPTPSPASVTNLSRTARSAYKETQRPPAGVAPPAESLPPNSSRSTLQIAPAPPPMPRLDPLPIAPPSFAPPIPAPELAKEPSSKFPTLVMFGDDTVPNPPPVSSEEAPPIVVPPNEPSGVTNAVTRPPPWGDGVVGIDIPKSPPIPGAAAARRDSEAPRPMELSSSDLTSEARIAVVKAQPLVAAERPRTMAGLGPELLAQNRATVAATTAAASPPPAPLSQSDVASTTRWAAQRDSAEPSRSAIVPQATPRATTSGAKLHDLTEIAADRAKRAYADLRERTKDKPSWFLPVVAGGSAFVLLILCAAGVKATFGSSSSTSSTSSASTSSTSSTSTSTSATTSSTSASPAPPALVRAMTCKTMGAPRDVAPKAMIGSGVEVATVGDQIALGFAIAPKEAALEVLDANSLASSSALHLRSNDTVRRVLALDATKAAIDSDHKGDKLQGRRTLRGTPPIDLGAMDGGLAWAPHGSEKGVKLWSLAESEAPVEALRGEALPNGGYAIAFRQSGAIRFGTFAGTPPAPLGNLGHAQGLGAQVGSPAIAVSGDHVMVAWSDRASKEESWSVRYVSFRVGEEDRAQAKAFTPPAGGLGGETMSPGLTSLGSGRFLLVWTEGPVSSHQVRGVAFGENGPTGDPFTASAEGVNAGQGQAAITSGGHGVVAFLAQASGKTFEVAAAPIQCVEK